MRLALSPAPECDAAVLTPGEQDPANDPPWQGRGLATQRAAVNKMLRVLRNESPAPCAEAGRFPLGEMTGAAPE